MAKWRRQEHQLNQTIIVIGTSNGRRLKYHRKYYEVRYLSANMDSLTTHVSVEFDQCSSCYMRNASLKYSLLVNHKQLNKLIIIPGVAP